MSLVHFLWLYSTTTVFPGTICWHVEHKAKSAGGILPAVQETSLICHCVCSHCSQTASIRFWYCLCYFALCFGKNQSQRPVKVWIIHSVILTMESTGIVSLWCEQVLTTKLIKSVQSLSLFIAFPSKKIQIYRITYCTLTDQLKKLWHFVRIFTVGVSFCFLFPRWSFRLHILLYYLQSPLRTVWTCICWIYALRRILGVAIASGWLTSHSGLERYQRDPGIVGTLWRPLVACYKAALTSEPEGRRWSRGCMNDHRGSEARGYAGQCLLHRSLSVCLCQFSYVILTPADEKIHFQSGLQNLDLWDTNLWNFYFSFRVYFLF